MSYPNINDLTIADLRQKLGKMGMSLDKKEHTKDYYIQLYLDKSNAKGKIHNTANCSRHFAERYKGQEHCCAGNSATICLEAISS